MFPREILKFSFSKMHIWRILRENLRKNEPKLMVQISCVLQQIDNYRYPKCVGRIPLSQFVAIFLLEDVALLLYTLFILQSSHFFYKLKKMQPSSKVGPVNRTGSAGPERLT